MAWNKHWNHFYSWIQCAQDDHQTVGWSAYPNVRARVEVDSSTPSVPKSTPENDFPHGKFEPLVALDGAFRTWNGENQSNQDLWDLRGIMDAQNQAEAHLRSCREGNLDLSEGQSQARNAISASKKRSVEAKANAVSPSMNVLMWLSISKPAMFTFPSKRCRSIMFCDILAFGWTDLAISSDCRCSRTLVRRRRISGTDKW